MPNPILSSVLNISQFQVLDGRSGDQIWKSLGIISVNVDSEAANAQKPLAIQNYSDESTFNDLQEGDIEASKIIQPTMMRVVGMVPDVTTAESILSVWEDVFMTIDITSRGVVASNMAISRVIIEQSPEYVSADKIIIDLEQVAVPSIIGFSPSQAADGNVVGLKIQTPKTALETIEGIYNRVLSFTGVF